jgi:opacity protein-like surface antigen
MKNIKTACLALALSSIATVATANDTNGVYAGLSFGNLTAKGAGATFAKGKPIGAFIGYNVSMYDNFTFGIEIEHAKMDFDYTTSTGAADMTSTTFKARFGYDITSATTVFAVLGKSKFEIPTYHETANTFGLGADYAVGKNMLLGLEALRTNFDFDTDFTTLKLRAAYKF